MQPTGSLSVLEEDSRGTAFSDTESLQSLGLATPAATVSLAHRENKAVTWSKALVGLVLCIATCAFATTTFRYTKRQEEQDFQTRVRNHNECQFHSNGENSPVP